MCCVEQVCKKEADKLEGYGYKHVPEEGEHGAGRAWKGKKKVIGSASKVTLAYSESTIISPMASEENGACTVVSQ